MKKSRGNYRTRRPNKKTILAAILNSGGIVSAIAERLQCSWGTTKIWIDKYEECKTALQDETEKLLDIGESALVKNIKAGDERAIEFLLSTKGKHRGFTTRQEVTGIEGKKIEFELTIRK